MNLVWSSKHCMFSRSLLKKQTKYGPTWKCWTQPERWHTRWPMMVSGPWGSVHRLYRLCLLWELKILFSPHYIVISIVWSLTVISGGGFARELFYGVLCPVLIIPSWKGLGKVQKREIKMINGQERFPYEERLQCALHKSHIQSGVWELPFRVQS